MEPNNALKILVLDDTAAHRESAALQLAGHNLTIVSSYSEACKLLESEVGFDMALLDLMMPAADMRALDDNRYQFEGQELPMGTILAFQALKVGVQKVGVLTDMNHHKHPASAAFDSLGGGWERPRPICIGNARLFLTNLGGGSFSHYVKRRTSKQFDGEYKPWLAACLILCSEEKESKGHA